MLNIFGTDPASIALSLCNALEKDEYIEYVCANWLFFPPLTISHQVLVIGW